MQQAARESVSPTAVGDPFNPTEPQQFIAIGTTNSQLYRSVTASDGTLTLEEIGVPAPIGYNGIGYNTVDNYIYGTVTGGNAEFPTGSLVRIDSTGTVTRVGTEDNWPYAAGTIGPDGLMLVGDFFQQVWKKVDPTTGQEVGTLTLSQPLSSFTGVTGFANDIAYADGFYWASASSHLYRINPVTGQVDALPSPVPSATTGGIGAGAAFTFGNGNLGFVYNETGNWVQIKVTDPGSANPMFELIGVADGPANGNNDATSSPGLPADLQVEKDAAAWHVAGDQITYTITVTNTGPGVSSGHTMTDTLPAGLTNITPPPGCAIDNQTITCVSGRLEIGGSIEYTLTASAPNPSSTCLTNEATVLGNEVDPVNTNNLDTAQTCPVVTDVVKTPVGQPRANTDGTHTIQFRIAVTRTGHGPGYALTDTLAFGKGITIKGVTAANTAPGTITPSNGWDPGTGVLTIVRDQPIADGVTHTYLVTVTAIIDAEKLTYSSSDCTLQQGESGTGFLNTARVTLGRVTEEDGDCVEAFDPVPMKTVTSGPTALGGGKYKMVYRIDVTNPYAGSGEYDLDDVLKYGEPVTLAGQPQATAITRGLSALENQWNAGSTTLRIQTDEPIPAAAGPTSPTVHSYQVTVRFTMEQEKVTSKSSNCQLTAGESGTGLLNTARLRVDDATSVEEACSKVRLPDLEMDKKAISGPSATVGDLVRYRLRVFNKGLGDAAAPIRLRDALPRGLELRSASDRGWACEVVKRTDVVSCVRDGGLAAGKRAPAVIVVARATQDAAGRKVVNTAVVRGQGDRNSRNDRDRSGVTVHRVPPAPATGYRLGWHRGAW